MGAPTFLEVDREKYLAFREAVSSLPSGDSRGPTVKVEEPQLKCALALGLGLIDPKRPLGTDLFNAHARLGITIAIEAVCLREADDGTVEVLLTQRAANDPAYPGQQHCPGSAKRSGECDEDVFARLAKAEFFARITHKAFVTKWNNPHEARGHFEHYIYWCVIEGDSKGKWFPATALPENTVDHHRDTIIPIAIPAFLNWLHPGLL